MVLVGESAEDLRPADPALGDADWFGPPGTGDLTGAIGAFIDAYNDRCRPFTWTKTPAF